MIVVGLPGTGKSLLVREAARFAIASGRSVQLLQWDVARLAWDTPEILTRFPEVDGVTHAAIRKAIGFWVRAAMLEWSRKHGTGNDLLLVEAPIIGGRFAELAKRVDDGIESHLAGPETLFVVLAPTARLQAELRRLRAVQRVTIANALERHNASVAVLDGLVAIIERIAPQLGRTPQFCGTYDPGLYIEVMQTVLKHRNVLALRPDRVIDTSGSVYDLGREALRIGATPTEVADTLARAQALDPEKLRQEVELGWAFT